MSWLLLMPWFWLLVNLTAIAAWVAVGVCVARDITKRWRRR